MMAQQPMSLQDLIRNRQQSGFVGRFGQLAQYQENLGLTVDDDRRRFLFNIHGDAGVGKTYLTRQLCQLAASNGMLTAYIDESADDATAAMSAIAWQLAQAGVRLGGFEKRAKAYWRHRHELESDPKAPEDIAAFLTKTAVTIGLAAARDIPVAGSLLAPVDTGMAADEVNQARLYLTRRLGDHADVRLMLSPSDELTPVFVAELNRIATTRPVALFVDTYERTGLILDQWLRRLYDGRYGGLPMTLVTTISGQNPLDPNLWGDYLPVIADVALEPFSDAEARQFLSSKNINSEELIQVILSLSGRLPLLLATLAHAKPASVADIGDPAGDVVERFLRWEDDPARRRIAIAAALPRTLNQDVLAEVAETGEAHELFGWLCGLPFISRRERSWAYHEVVRAAMLRLQRAQAPSEWASRHIALAGAHERWAREAAGDHGADWSNTQWIDHFREQSYHELCVAPDANLPGALKSSVKAATNGAIRARHWAQLISDVGKDADHPKLCEWGQLLDESVRDNDLTGYFTRLIDKANLDQSTLCTAFAYRGDGYRRTGRYDEAITDLTSAIEINPEYLRAIAVRGSIYQLMGRHAEALSDLNRTIEIDPQDAWAFTMRGRIHQLMERYAEALADLDRAIEINPQHVQAIIARSDINRLMGRYGDVVVDLTRIIELSSPDKKIAAFGARGEIYCLMKRYDEAIIDLTRAIKLDPQNAVNVASRGHTFSLMEHYDEALADLNRAIELDPQYAWAIAARGQVHRFMGHYDEALADLTRAIELDPDNAKIIVARGEAYIFVERYGLALADLNRAIELDPQYAWAIADRGQVHRFMGHYDEALADLTRAIELNPQYFQAIAARGQVHRLVEHYDEALADLDYAIELNPEDNVYKVERAEVYRLRAAASEL